MAGRLAVSSHRFGLCGRRQLAPQRMLRGNDHATDPEEGVGPGRVNPQHIIW